MKQIVFDIETNGLDPTKVHCLVHTRGAGGMLTGVTNYKDIKSVFDHRDCVYIGHNIARYDLPVLRKLVGVKGDIKFVDTLALSWYLYPKRLKHGLAEWGMEFGIPKPLINDWDDLPIAEYLHRCTEDVKINEILWRKIWADLMKLYNDDEAECWRLIHYLTFKMQCAADQETIKWKVDLEKVEANLEILSEKYNKAHDALTKEMPKLKLIAKKTRPKKPYKADGSYSVVGAKWFALLKKKGKAKGYMGEVEVVTGEEEPNPNSTVQIKDWLYSLGWVPATFKYSRNKQTNELRKIEQVRKDVDGEKSLCESVLLLVKKAPAIKFLQEITILNHRIGILKGFLSNADEEGYVQARITGFTNTLRFKHTVVVNLPGVNKIYGGMVRECLVCPDGYELVGADMMGLEERTKHHYMYPHDPEYVEEMNTKGFDPHLDIGLLAKMVTERQVQAYKDGDKSIAGVRHDAKQVNYSCTYGVTPPGIVRNTGMPLKNAKTLHKTFWKRNWSLITIAKECVVKSCIGGDWLYNPVSRFWYSLRSEKDKFSTLNQGTGVFCFDSWIRYVKQNCFVYIPIVGQMHDEIIGLRDKNVHRDNVIQVLKTSIKKVNEDLNLNREMDVDVQFGKSYSEIH